MATTASIKTIEALVGKKIDELDLKAIVTPHYARYRVWDARRPSMGDCQFDVTRLNIHVGEDGVITKYTEG